MLYARGPSACTKCSGTAFSSYARKLPLSRPSPTWILHKTTCRPSQKSSPKITPEKSQIGAWLLPLADAGPESVSRMLLRYFEGGPLCTITSPYGGPNGRGIPFWARGGGGVGPDPPPNPSFRLSIVERSVDSRDTARSPALGRPALPAALGAGSHPRLAMPTN